MGNPSPTPEFLEVGDEKKLRLPCENPKQEEQMMNPAMERLRDYVVMELAVVDPSKLVGSGTTRRLHSRVERQFRSLISNFHTPTHPPYASMIFRAIENLNEGGGSSTKAISAFIVREYENLPLGHEGILQHQLGKLCETRDVLCMDDGRYILPVDDSAVNRVVAAVESNNRKKRRGRKTGVSRSRGVVHRGGEETKGGEIGEENQSMEQDIEGQIEWQEMDLDRIDDEKEEKEQGEGGEVLNQRNEEKNETVKEHVEAERQEMKLTEQEMGIVIDMIDDEKEGEEERKEREEAVDQINEEKNEAVKEQSDAERQEMEVTEDQTQITSRTLNDEGGSNGDEIVQTFIKAKAKVSENKEYIEAGGQQHEWIKEQQHEISFEQNEPQPEQTEVQKQQQQDKAKLNSKISSASPLNEENIESGELQTDVIEEQQLGISSLQKLIQPQQAEIIEEKIQLEEVQKQDQREGYGQEVKIKVKHDTLSASALAATIPPIKQSEVPIMQFLHRSKSAKKKLFPQQEHNKILLQRKKLRSYTQSNVPESASSSTILEPSSLSEKHELQKEAPREGPENQDQQRPPKEKRDERRDMKTESPLDFHPHHDEQPLKCYRVQGRHAKPTPDADAIKEASDVQVQNEEQQRNPVQLQRRILRSHNKEHSVPESAKTTTTPSSMPPKTRLDEDAIKEASDVKVQKEEQQQNQAQLLKRVLRSHNKKCCVSEPAKFMPSELTPDENAIKEASDVQVQNEQQQQNQTKLRQRILRSHNKKPSIIDPAKPMMSSVSSKNQVVQQQQGRRQGKSPKPQIDAQRTVVCALPSASQRGRSPKPQIDADTNVVRALPSASQHHEEAKPPPKQHERGRHPKLKTATKFNAGWSALSSALQDINEEDKQPAKPPGQRRPRKQKQGTEHREEEQQPPKRRRLGRPPLPIPSKYMLIKQGKLQLPVRGRGRPPKAKQDAKSTKDVISASKTHLEEPKQDHKNGRGRPPKTEGRPSEGCHLPERPKETAEEGLGSQN